MRMRERIWLNDDFSKPINVIEGIMKGGKTIQESSEFLRLPTLTMTMPGEEKEWGVNQISYSLIKHYRAASQSLLLTVVAQQVYIKGKTLNWIMWISFINSLWCPRCKYGKWNWKFSLSCRHNHPLSAFIDHLVHHPIDELSSLHTGNMLAEA